MPAPAEGLKPENTATRTLLYTDDQDRLWVRRCRVKVNTGEAKRDAELYKLYGEKGEISFGSQIRSYVMQPYRIVKDHRTKVEIGDVDRVMDGDLSQLIRGYLLARRNEKG